MSAIPPESRPSPARSYGSGIFRLRFSLAAALVGLVACAAAMAWIGRPWLLERQWAAEDAALQSLGADCGRIDGRVLRISFYSERMTDDVLGPVLRHPELEWLETYNPGITDPGPPPVPDHGLTDAGVSRLAALPKLRRLQLHGRGITDAALPTLAGLPELVDLLLLNTSVSEAALRRHFAGREGRFELRRGLLPDSMHSPKTKER